MLWSLGNYKIDIQFFCIRSPSRWFRSSSSISKFCHFPQFREIIFFFSFFCFFLTCRIVSWFLIFVGSDLLSTFFFCSPNALAVFWFLLVTGRNSEMSRVSHFYFSTRFDLDATVGFFRCLIWGNLDLGSPWLVHPRRPTRTCSTRTSGGLI